MRVYAFFIILLIACASHSSAQTITLTFSSDPSGIVLSGSGTSAASLSFGTVQAFGGTVPSGVSKATDANARTCTLSTTVDVEVTYSRGFLGAASSSYSLAAQLQSADVQNTWKWQSVALSTARSTIATNSAYSTTTPNSFSLVIPFTESAGSISNTIDVTVTAN
jgi:hypothetical protein